MIFAPLWLAEYRYQHSPKALGLHNNRHDVMLIAQKQPDWQRSHGEAQTIARLASDAIVLTLYSI
jgi:hypothetical protein